MTNLASRDLATFKRLRISPELLSTNKIERFTDVEARELLAINGKSGNMAGIFFPYFDPKTGRRWTGRLRRDHPEIEDGQEKNKYLSAYGDRRHLYLVKGSEAYLEDKSVPVVLVEAEKSALAIWAWAQRTGQPFLPIAMGGCWGWRGRIGKVENASGERVDEKGPLPEMKYCAERITYILLDANCTAANPNVLWARRSLAGYLTKIRAKVRVLDLPGGNGVNGPDDFLAVLGDEALAELIDSATPEKSEENWREGCKSFAQLSSLPPRFLLSGLIPENALTAVPAPSYHCKTWLALQMGHAVSIGLPMFCFDVPEKVPVIYHVPEMNEALIRERMAMLGIEDSENFLVRPMELGIWGLKDPRMLESSRGRLVFLDTQGFFNEADDQNSYNQALRFAENVFNLLNQGARAVVMLTHPPKYATQRLQKEPPWTLENSIIGSAAYGGILRSCLRLRNLNLDLNDKHPWIYIQGLKNPGMKPFQLEDIPLRLKAAPGESPYLHDLLAGIEDQDSDPRQKKAYEMFARGSSNRRIIEELKSRNDTVSKWRKQWELERKEQAQEDADEAIM